MKFPFFASCIVFCMWLFLQLSKQKKKEASALDDFYEKERKANHTRKKSLDDLNYITLPIESMHFDLLMNHEEAEECKKNLQSLADKKIVNFTGLTNTDLKLAYGTANIGVLSSFDQNYTILARTLNKWGNILFENGHMEAAKDVLEFAISTDTDISSTYKLLAKIYLDSHETSKIGALKERAGHLRSAMSNPIVRMLQESDPYNGSPDSW